MHIMLEMYVSQSGTIGLLIDNLLQFTRYMVTVPLLDIYLSADPSAESQLRTELQAQPVLDQRRQSRKTADDHIHDTRRCARARVVLLVLG